MPCAKFAQLFKMLGRRFDNFGLILEDCRHFTVKDRVKTSHEKG